MPIVVVDGVSFDPNKREDAAALFDLGFEYRMGQWVPKENVVAPEISYQGPALGGTGSVAGPVAGVVSNPIYNSPQFTSVDDPNSGGVADALAGMKAYAVSAYGSDELGTIRRSPELS